MRFDSERVLQIVLSKIHKTSTRFKVYEGVRIGEIQAATGGNLTCWAWMSGQRNTADWLTRGRAPEVQKSFESELTKTDRKGRKGDRFACLNPVQDKSGLWVVGQRLKNKNPMTVDSSLQKLLLYRHHVTRLFMRRAHSSGDRGRDATLARFRQLYWVTQGSKLAQSIKSKCQMCKLREAKFLEQQMGQLPEARLKPAPAFNHVLIDLFGPYSVRGEVQKRTSGKAYQGCK
jgi:hypothetical protein